MDRKSWLCVAAPVTLRLSLGLAAPAAATAAEACTPGKTKKIAFMLKQEMDYRKFREQELKERNEALRQREEELTKSNQALHQALQQVKALRGMIPICSSCKRIRNDQNYWQRLEDYLQEHSEAEFSHSLCIECAKRLYPGVYNG